MASTAFSSFTPSLQLSLRAAVAAGLSILVAQLLGLQYPLYAMISAVIVTDLEASKTRKLGLPRLIGTVLGGTLGAAICTLLHPGVLAVSIGILLAMFLSSLMEQRDAAKVAGYVSAIVLLDHNADPWIYSFHRTLETLLGIGVALVVSFVPKLLPSGNAPPNTT
jgi:uncharacterized membrane protein YgaE (UPF0421/DUF939 family)